MIHENRSIPRPRVLTWHAWSLLSVILFRLECVMGPFGVLIQEWKWRAIEKANSAYPVEDRRRSGLAPDREEEV